MTKTASTMLPLGTALPAFDLKVANIGKLMSEDISNRKDWKTLSSECFKSKPLLIMVICAHCPFVKHIEKGLTKIQNDFSNVIDLLAISSNSLVTHPQDGPEFLAKQAKDNSWEFPYLFDEDQLFAKSLKAACTPDFFFFVPSSDGFQRLFYRGQFDESRPGNDLEVNGSDLRKAITSCLSSHPYPKKQKPSIGCNIKWHPGKEPSWFG